MFGSALTATLSGPYVVEGNISHTDYVICTHQRRKKNCHINMLKSFHSQWTEQEMPENNPETAALGSSSLGCTRSETDELVAPVVVNNAVFVYCEPTLVLSIYIPETGCH